MDSIRRAFDLSDRVAIVTGGAVGIGRATAALLAEAGARVVVADRDADAGRRTAEELGGAGERVGFHEVDVSRRRDVEALVDDTRRAHGRLDVMVNNAGIITDAPFLEITEEDLDRVHAVNFKGVFFGCQAAGRVMVEQRSGSIVNIASGAIDLPTPNLVPYATAKAAVAQLSRTVAVELAPYGVRVNAVAPGFVDTPMNERHATGPDGRFDRERHAEMLAARAGLSPLGLVGEPRDIAWAVLYLASEAGRFMTGTVLRPNGGSTMPW
jgi:3-oxoacyl-[acyl-carrier protein] reductase